MKELFFHTAAFNVDNNCCPKQGRRPYHADLWTQSYMSYLKNVERLLPGPESSLYQIEVEVDDAKNDSTDQDVKKFLIKKVLV